MQQRDTELETTIKSLLQDKVSEVLCFEQLPSVMDLHKRMQFEVPALILAKDQTQGRGQHGRTWSSNKGALLACLCFPVTKQLHCISPLSLVFALQVAKVLNELGVEARLKWPNDILAGKELKKICGILLEMAARKDSSEALLRVGLGLNVEEHPQTGASILSETGKTPYFPELAASLYLKCHEAFQSFFQNGFKGFSQEWNMLNTLASKKVSFETDGRIIHGISEGVDLEGNFLLRTENNRLESFQSGRVSLI